MRAVPGVRTRRDHASSAGRAELLEQQAGEEERRQVVKAQVCSMPSPVSRRVLNMAPALFTRTSTAG